VNSGIKSKNLKSPTLWTCRFDTCKKTEQKYSRVPVCSICTIIGEISKPSAVSLLASVYPTMTNIT
jgi:hypothetical protein